MCLCIRMVCLCCVAAPGGVLVVVVVREKYDYSDMAPGEVLVRSSSGGVLSSLSSL